MPLWFNAIGMIMGAALLAAGAKEGRWPESILGIVILAVAFASVVRLA